MEFGLEKGCGFVLFYNSKFHGRILTYLYKSRKSEETQGKLLLL